RDLLVAVERHQHRVPDGDRIGAERHGLGHVAAVPDAAGINEADLAPLAELIDGAARLADSGDTWHAGVLGGDMRSSAGATLHGVDIDGVWPALHRHAHIVIDSRRAKLEQGGGFPSGSLADLLALERKVVRARPATVARR